MLDGMLILKICILILISSLICNFLVWMYRKMFKKDQVFTKKNTQTTNNNAYNTKPNTSNNSNINRTYQPTNSNSSYNYASNTTTTRSSQYQNNTYRPNQGTNTYNRPQQNTYVNTARPQQTNSVVKPVVPVKKITYNSQEILKKLLSARLEGEKLVKEFLKLDYKNIYSDVYFTNDYGQIEAKLNNILITNKGIFLIDILENKGTIINNKSTCKQEDVDNVTEFDSPLIAADNNLSIFKSIIISDHIFSVIIFPCASELKGFDVNRVFRLEEFIKYHNTKVDLLSNEEVSYFKCLIGQHFCYNEDEKQSFLNGYQEEVEIPNSSTNDDEDNIFGSA